MLSVVLSCTLLSAQDVERLTYHYATNDGVELYLDRYDCAVESEDVRPCMIFAFGGGFVQGVRDHEYYHHYFNTLAREGIVVVSIDYRLGLKGANPNRNIRAMIDIMTNAVHIAVEDLYAATNYILANAEEWRVDPTKIMISGSSAGAITAVEAEWMRCNGHKLAEVLPKDFRYAAVVSCAGAIYSDSGKPKFRSKPAPMLLFHGSSDRNVPYDHAAVFGVGFFGSKYIAKQLDKLDSPYMFYSAEYADHSMAGTPLYYQCDLIKQFIRDYVTDGHSWRIRTNASDLNGEKRPTKFTVKEYLETNYKRRK